MVTSISRSGASSISAPEDAPWRLAESVSPRPRLVLFNSVSLARMGVLGPAAIGGESGVGFVRGFPYGTRSRVLGACSKETVDFADVESAQFSRLTDGQGFGDGECVDGVADPSLGLGYDSFSFEYGCRGHEDLVTDPRLSGGQGFTTPDKLILRPEAGLLTNAA